MPLAEFNLIEHISDHPWPGFVVEWGGQTIVLMSSGIASMILVAIFLVAFIVPLARRTVAVPHGSRNVLEVIIFFVRDWIAKPALHDKAYKFMPFLLTQFLFFAGMNFIGILPLSQLSQLVKINGQTYPVGFTPTSILTVTGANAALTLVVILYFSFREQARRYRSHRGGSALKAGILSPLLFVKSLVPVVPGITGALLWPMLAFLEIASLFSKCGALMIRLFANMLAGHSLLAVFMGFIVVALETNIGSLVFIGPLSVLGSLFVILIEVLVAGLQAYIFTFLSAIFIALYMEPAH